MAWSVLWNSVIRDHSNTTRDRATWHFKRSPAASSETYNDLLLLPQKGKQKQMWGDRLQRVKTVTRNNPGPTVDHKIEQALWDFPFFFFALGGWSTTLMAASNTPFTFWSNNISNHILQWNASKRCWAQETRSSRQNIPPVFLNYIQCRKVHQLFSSALHP